MYPLSSIFAFWKAPFSGDVTQNIEPRLFSNDIAGDPATESYIHAHVASYGTQLDAIMGALLELAPETKDSQPGLRKLQALSERIDTAKKDLHLAAATLALDRLKAADPEGYASCLRARMPPD
ncbi:hypothetical protein KM176_24010 [Pseudooceanicola sp. CBS1P-1]|uniref:Uncharacterized protein n=1 Tax=Pseudooceanicola albus TaxID=2692189 RepID=A0A6L7GA06_9RHOB|nr:MULTISPECIES: hypothetical protein [Pseudooceanicola]MBT9386928.1 hypothetical protein [Pseudooceanicola endophyticus]MXN21034.1 hypothetical protein [Pseudooceanicola albus]